MRDLKRASRLRCADPVPRRRSLQLERLEPRSTPSADLFQNMVDEMLEEAPQQVIGAPWYLSRMRADGSFSDLNYAGNTDASANDLRGHGARLEVLALAYKWNNPANHYFGDATLKTQILQGWSYLASHGGSVTAPNWWWKAIGVPRAIGDGLVLMRSEISAPVQSQILSRYFSTVWEPWKYDGANRAYQATPAMIDGLLRGDTARIRDVVATMTSEIFAYSGEGIARDLSFRQHIVGGKYEYQTGAYGLVFAKDTARVMRWAGGTTYAFSTAAVDEELKYVLDGMAWITRGDALDIPAQGRSITRPGSAENAPSDLNLAMHDMLPLGRRTSELSAAIDRYEHGVTPDNALVGNKSFWVGDAMANQRPQMLTTVKLLSNRTGRPETAAGENPQGFFEGDGFTMFVQDGDEFGSRGGPEIFPVWDWQRLPGTTVEHNGSIPYYDMFQTSANSTGGSGIVGSVSDGKYGLAAMDYRRSGVSVTAKKAWFFFDYEVVALGAGINDSSSAAPVYTSLNQVLLDGNMTVEDAGGRRTLALGSSASLSGSGWIEHDGLGYVLLDPTSHTTVQAAQQSGGGTTLPVFSAWVDHGVHPQNATYAYAVVPGMTPDALDQYSSNLPIKILANTSAVQAVENPGLAQAQIAFYAAGSVRLSDGTTITVNQPANLIIKQSANTLTITAADPQQTASSLTIDISRVLAGSGTQAAAGGSTRITFPLPATPYNGSSATRTFAIVDTTPPEAPLIATISPDTGISAGDHITSNPALVLTGSAEAGSTVNLFRDGAQVGTALASGGSWTFDATALALPAGSFLFTATATDAAGNVSTLSSPFRLVVDTKPPVITPAAISLAGASGTGGAFRRGDTITASWNNTAAGDNSSNIDNSDIAGVVFDFRAVGGGLAGATENAGVWTASYRVPATVLDLASWNIGITATDLAGNVTALSRAAAPLDAEAPRASALDVVISGSASPRGGFLPGDTLAFVWNGAAGDRPNADITGVIVDFAGFDGGPPVAAANMGGSWLLTHPVLSGITSRQSPVLMVTLIDDAGNTASVDIPVTATNEPPTLAPPGVVVISDDATSIPVPLSHITAGPAETQHLSIAATSDNPAVIPDPLIAYTSPEATAQLTLVPVRGQYGTATITVTVEDDGGTASGGRDRLALTFVVSRPAPIHNRTNAFDVSGDGQVVPLDALLVINYLNSADLQAAALYTPGPPYYDVSNDHQISPLDALLVINHLNEASQADLAGQAAGEPPPGDFETTTCDKDAWLLLLAIDVAQGRRRPS